MKTIVLEEEKQPAAWTRERIGCRGIVLDGGKMLLSYGVKNELWMVPGGGLEPGESDAECCLREIAEETGVVCETTSDCLLEITEFHESLKMVNRYFLCKAVGVTERKRTEVEERIGMEARWLPTEEIKAIFAGHEAFAGVNEMRRVLYLREYTALTELL